MSDLNIEPNAGFEDEEEVWMEIPPDDIKNLVDKTAEYVAKNGPAFEEVIQKSEANNPKFLFLNPDHSYRAYYDQKVHEFSEKLTSEKEKEEKED